MPSLGENLGGQGYEGLRLGPSEPGTLTPGLAGQGSGEADSFAGSQAAGGLVRAESEELPLRPGMFHGATACEARSHCHFLVFFKKTLSLWKTSERGGGSLCAEPCALAPCPHPAEQPTLSAGPRRTPHPPRGVSAQATSVAAVLCALCAVKPCDLV